MTLFSETLYDYSIATELSAPPSRELESTMEAAKPSIKIYDRIATGLMLACATGFIVGALYALGF